MSRDHHSRFNDFAGSANAALEVCRTSVNTAIQIPVIEANTNIRQRNAMRFERVQFGEGVAL
jgi:hypothetical protein